MAPKVSLSKRPALYASPKRRGDRLRGFLIFLNRVFSLYVNKE